MPRLRLLYVFQWINFIEYRSGIQLTSRIHVLFHHTSHDHVELDALFKLFSLIVRAGRPKVSVLCLKLLYATAYPAELGIRPLGYYKPMQYKILGSGTWTMLDNL
jgi:hypothetical protein